MGLETVIVKQVVRVAKDTGKLETSLSLMEEKLKLQGVKVIEQAGIDPSVLPFNLEQLLDGNVENPGSLLTPQSVCSIPPLTDIQKENALRETENVLININNIISNKNKIATALQTVQTPLTTLATTATTLDNIITTVKTAIKVIKAIPIPTAIIPPQVGGLGVPINVLTILSDSLDQLDKLLTMGKGVTKSVPILSRAVLNMITMIINKLNGLDSIIEPVITTVQIVQTVAEVGDQCPNLTQGSINDVTTAISQDIIASVAASGDNSSLDINAVSEADLVASLQSNASPGLVYKGFKMVLESNPENPYSFPQRRVAATRDFASDPNMVYKLRGSLINALTPFQSSQALGEVTLYNSPSNEPQGRYSYSASTQVLVEEMKWKIDKYMLGVLGKVVVQEVEPDRNDPGTETDDNTNVGTNFVPWTLNGPDTVIPKNQNTGDFVTGTITITSPILIQMITNGGTAQDSFTQSEITFQKGNKPLNAQLSRQAYAERNQVINSNATTLTETGIWNYRLSIIENLQDTNNSARFVITPLFDVLGGAGTFNPGVGGVGGSSGTNSGGNQIIIDDLNIFGNNTNINQL